MRREAFREVLLTGLEYETPPVLAGQAALLFFREISRFRLR
jgi:hypothetical protein